MYIYIYHSLQHCTVLRSDAVAEKMNEELKGVIHVSRTHQSSSHMWTSDTLCYYLDFLKKEIHRRRVALKLPFEARAMVLCDAAAVHSAALYAKVRERFERESNCLLITGSSGIHDDTHAPRPTIPGGWGACGTPNDAWHQWFHFLRRGWMRVCIGMAGSTKIRKALADMQLAIDGNNRISTLDSDFIQSLLLYFVVSLNTLQGRHVLYSIQQNDHFYFTVLPEFGFGCQKVQLYNTL